MTPGRCSRHFNSWKALEQHNNYSSNHFPCHHCNESYDFESYDKLLWHWEMGPEHEPTYCSWCDLHFSSRGARTQHKRDTPDKHQPCWRCNRDFQTKEDLEGHWQTSEAHQTTYCHVCQEEFGTAQNLREVARISDGFQTATDIPFSIKEFIYQRRGHALLVRQLPNSQPTEICSYIWRVGLVAVDIAY